MKLLIEAVIKYLMGLVLVGAMLFLPAGGFDYVNGWLFIGLMFVPMLALGTVLFIKSPSLLAKRLNSKEKVNTQKYVTAASGIIFMAGFAVAGLDHRFGWTDVPKWVVIVSSVILLASYAMYMEVMRENVYLSRTVEVSDGQTVVDTGLYGVVRHPMYAATLWLFHSIPLVLGSWWAMLCFAPYTVIIVVRIISEEKVLTAELNGYEDYKKKVKYRLIPFVW